MYETSRQDWFQNDISVLKTRSVIDSQQFHGLAIVQCTYCIESSRAVIDKKYLLIQLSTKLLPIRYFDSIQRIKFKMNENQQCVYEEWLWFACGGDFLTY